MSSANPLSFFGGMFLEVGAAIAVIAILWQPQQGDARPALQPVDYFASRPVHFAGNSTPNYVAPQPEFPAYRAAQPYLPMQEQYRLLPPAPPSYAEMPRETRIETARPRVRTFANQQQSFEQQPQYSMPQHRTAEARRDDYYDRY